MSSGLHVRRGNTPPAPAHAHAHAHSRHPELVTEGDSTQPSTTHVHIVSGGGDSKNPSALSSPIVATGDAGRASSSNAAFAAATDGAAAANSSSSNPTSPLTGEGEGESKDKEKAAGGGILAGFASESTLPLHQSALIALLYTIGSTVFFLLIRYSKKLEKEGSLVYDNAAAVFFMELLKCTFSVCAMWYRTGKFLPVSVFREGSWRVGLYYAVPSFIYAVYNNLTYLNLTANDPATFQVFMQTRVLFTGVLYSAIFHKHLSRQKWIALVCLMGGVASKYFSWNMKVDSGIFFLLFQASLSAFAGVYNEFLLKRDISMDVNEQNFFMYAFALFFNLSFGLMTNPDYYTSGKVFVNLNSIFLWIVCCGALMGISASLVLKFINVIVKAFASATEVLITAVLAAMFLGEALTGRDFFACCVVMVAIYLYYHVPRGGSGDDAAAAAEKKDGRSVSPVGMPKEMETK